MTPGLDHRRAISEPLPNFKSNSKINVRKLIKLSKKRYIKLRPTPLRIPSPVPASPRPISRHPTPSPRAPKPSRPCSPEPTRPLRLLTSGPTIAERRACDSQMTPSPYISSLLPLFSDEGSMQRGVCLPERVPYSITRAPAEVAVCARRLRRSQNAASLVYLELGPVASPTGLLLLARLPHSIIVSAYRLITSFAYTERELLQEEDGSLPRKLVGEKVFARMLAYEAHPLGDQIFGEEAVTAEAWAELPRATEMLCAWEDGSEVSPDLFAWLIERTC